MGPVPYTSILFGIVIIATAAFFVGLARARAAQAGGTVKLHSQVGYYGWFSAILAGLPALLLITVWSASEPTVLSHLVERQLPPAFETLDTAQRSLVMGQVEMIVEGLPKLDASH